jgi:UrcA family protein
MRRKMPAVQPNARSGAKQELNRRRKMIRTLSVAALAASVLSVSVQAKDSVTIDVSGVNFADPAQVSALYDKVLQASRDVCAEIYLNAPLRDVALSERRPLYAACVKETVDGAVKTADQPALTQLHAANDVDAYALASSK